MAYELTRLVRVYGEHETPSPSGVLILPHYRGYSWWNQNTRSVLRKMEALDLAGKRVLDFGAGPCGILGIAAAKVFGAERVGFIENKASIVDSLRRNVVANGLPELIWETPPRQRRWDVAIANVGDAELVEQVKALAPVGLGTDRESEFIRW